MVKKSETTRTKDTSTRDLFSRAWIISNAKDVIASYSEGITLRQLYYRLVAKGMTNDLKHYKRVVAAMTDARWGGDVEMTAFIDRERSMFGRTNANEKNLEDEMALGKRQVKAWMDNYHLERWSNQDNYVEVWIEKKALQGVFEMPCMMADVGLAPCKGYPSLTFLNEAAKRFKAQSDKRVVILYFGDYDPSGEDIPRSVEENLTRMGEVVMVKRIALMPGLIKELKLPGVPPKSTDSRTANWDGSSAVELDAVDPKMLAKMCEDAIKEFFDEDLFAELEAREDKEREEYQAALKTFVNGLGGE